MIKKIASTLNVSVSTVRRALGDFPDIGAETKERVKKTASDMGYRPDFLARAMITKKTLLIGLIVPEFDSTFFPRVISSVEGCAAKNGYRILIAKHDYSQEKFHAAVQTFSQYRVDGLILSPPEKELAESTRKEIRELARPVVFFDDDCPGEGLAWVGTDDIRAGEMAASYVVDCGFRRPAFTGRNTRSTSAQDRLDGFEKKLGGENIFLNPTFIFSGDFSEKTGEASAETILRSPGKPDVVFCANDQIAAGLMMKLREGGLRIPEDISIIGFGNLSFARLLPVGLTTFEQFPGQIGEKALERLLGLIRGEATGERRIEVPAELVERDSVKKGSKT